MDNRHLPVFVINLAAATGRLAKISRELREQGIAFERVEAVDGRKLVNPTGFVSPLSRLLRLKPPLPGEIGCWLSHRRIWERMLAEEIPLALVLEDDASPRVSYQELLRVQPAHLGLDLLRAHIRFEHRALQGKTVIPAQHSIAEREIVFQKGPIFSATAYFVTLEGARKLADVRKMFVPVDHLSFWGAFAGLRDRILLPNMFTADDDGASTIGDRMLGGAAQFHERLLARHFYRRLDRRRARRAVHRLHTLCGREVRREQMTEVQSAACVAPSPNRAGFGSMPAAHHSEPGSQMPESIVGVTER